MSPFVPSCLSMSALDTKQFAHVKVSHHRPLAFLSQVLWKILRELGLFLLKGDLGESSGNRQLQEKRASLFRKRRRAEGYTGGEEKKGWSVLAKNREKRE